MNAKDQAIRDGTMNAVTEWSSFRVRRPSVRFDSGLRRTFMRAISRAIVHVGHGRDRELSR